MARLIDSVIGHQSSWEKLRASGHLPHAMAFAGPNGIGKKRVAWALAQYLVCESAERPCGECGACRRVENQQSESVLSVEPVNGTIKLESAHQILQFLTLQRIGRARVVIVDEAQALNPQATNALLKVIEEPPPETYFILVVSELAQMLPTLRSRLQIVRFSPLSEEQLAAGESLPSWMLRSSRGSFSELANFRDPVCADLRAKTFGFLEGALRGEREGLDTILGEVKDRENVMNVIQFLQQLLRDWTVMDSADVVHVDLREKLAALKPLAVNARLALWQRALEVERDFVAHVDRGLLFENFFYSLRSAR